MPFSRIGIMGPVLQEAITRTLEGPELLREVKAAVTRGIPTDPKREALVRAVTPYPWNQIRLIHFAQAFSPTGARNRGIDLVMGQDIRATTVAFQKIILVLETTLVEDKIRPFPEDGVTGNHNFDFTAMDGLMVLDQDNPDGMRSLQQLIPGHIIRAAETPGWAEQGMSRGSLLVASATFNITPNPAISGIDTASPGLLAKINRQFHPSRPLGDFPQEVWMTLDQFLDHFLASRA